MTKFIPLTDQSGNRFHLNTQWLRAIHQNQNTSLELHDGTVSHVKETPEQVLALIHN